jgi:hypothetical protein
VHRGAGGRKTLRLDQVLPHHRDHRAGAVAELQAQVIPAVAARTALDRAHQQDLVDLDTV